MFKRLILSILFILLLTSPLNAAGTQLWNELRYTHPFKGSNFELFWASENRWDEGMSHFYLFNTSIGFAYRPRKWLSAGFFFLYERSTKNIINDFNDEERFNPFVELTLPLGASDLRFRNLFELRYLPDDGVSGDFRFRYRGRLRWQRKFVVGVYSFTPYVSNEVFVEPETNNFNQDRLIVGNSFGFLQGKLSFDVYYMSLATRSSANVWQRVDALGTNLGVRY